MFAEKILRKHVAIIHAYSMMSVLQRKIVNILLYETMQNKSYVANNDSVAIECCIPFSRVVKAVNFNSNNFQYLKEAIDGLASLKIEWNLLRDKTPTDISFLNLRVLHGAPTFYQNGTFNFSFHKLMLELVGNPLIYGTVDLDIQAQFESKYGHSLYENSTRFVHLQKSKIIHLDTFRKLLGVPENKYHTMRELTRNVIKPSIEEVNDRADFVVNIESIKAGKKITGFDLSVETKKHTLKNTKREDNSPESQTQQLIEQTFGKISEVVLNNLLKNYSENYILEKITYTKKHAKKEVSGLYPIRYFISALKEDYKSSDQLIKNLESEKSQDKPDVAIWQEKLQHLQADLANWKRNLDHAKSTNNFAFMNNAQTIVSQCEEKLQQHHAERHFLGIEGEVG